MSFKSACTNNNNEKGSTLQSVQKYSNLSNLYTQKSYTAFWTEFVISCKHLMLLTTTKKKPYIFLFDQYCTSNKIIFEKKNGAAYPAFYGLSTSAGIGRNEFRFHFHSIRIYLWRICSLGRVRSPNTSTK